MIERKCPSCGAPVRFHSSVSLLAVCPYCRSLTRRRDLDLEALGRVAQLQPDGTPIQLGARGLYKGDAFEVVGRVQLRTPKGFWNEWFLSYLDGRQGWLGEAQGTYALSFPLPGHQAPHAAGLKAGMIAEIGGREYLIREVVDAAYLSAEGELPFRPPLGETVRSADLISRGGFFATFDYSETPPLVFTGEYEEFSDLHFSGLRQFEGWPAP